MPARPFRPFISIRPSKLEDDPPFRPEGKIHIVENRTAFEVRDGDDFCKARIIRVSFPQSIFSKPLPTETRERREHLFPLLSIASGIVESYVRSNEIDFESHDVIDLEATSEDVAYEKECSYQDEKRGGLFCGATEKNDPSEGKTTKAICRQCSVPDDRARCSHFSHPKVIARNVTVGLLDIDTAFCEEASEAIREPGFCIPFGNKCWERIVFRPSASQEFESGLEKRVCDEIDHLNLRATNCLSTPVIQVKQARSMEELLSPCTSQQNLIVKVQVLAALLGSVDFSKLIKLKANEAKIQGSLIQLEKLLTDKGISYSKNTFKTLRAIVQVRNDYPAHLKSDDFVKAIKFLGLPHPFTNWSEVWSKILRAFTGSIRELRIALPI